MMFEIKDCLTIDIFFLCFFFNITITQSIAFCKNNNLLSDMSAYLLRKPCEKEILLPYHHIIGQFNFLRFPASSHYIIVFSKVLIKH